MLQSILPARLLKVSKVRWPVLSKLSIGWAVLYTHRVPTWRARQAGSQGGACHVSPTTEIAPDEVASATGVWVACFFLHVLTSLRRSAVATGYAPIAPAGGLGSVTPLVPRMRGWLLRIGKIKRF